MTAKRWLTATALTLGAIGVGWLAWPRPDTSIVIAEGGVATVIDGYGRRSSLGDTVFIAGSGPQRRVRLVNRDTMQHVLALFTIDAGEQMDYKVPQGTFGGLCTAHNGSQQLTLVVQ